MAEGRAPLPFEAKKANLRRGMEVSRILHEMPKPVVAQIDGAAAGAGLSIALSCDLRVAGASAKITTAFAKVGLSGDYGGTYFLTQMLGSAKARELYLMSPVLSAQEALALGIVTKVVPDAEVEAATHELAMSLAQGPTVTLGYIKTNINNAERLALEACFDAEAMHHSRSGDTADHKEAAKAFIEFNHTEGSDDVLGPYPPAGPDWQKSIRKDVTQALLGVEFESPDPQDLARHWGQIIGIPAAKSDSGEIQIVLPNCTFSFVN